MLLPLYALARLVPGLRRGAVRLGLVTLRQMIRALTSAVEESPSAPRLLDVPAIRAAR